MSEELKACPFCGAEAILNESDRSVDCTGCTASTYAQDHIKYAIDQWNTRPPPQITQATADRLARIESVIETSASMPDRWAAARSRADTMQTLRECGYQP